MSRQLILASGSPRRRELLTEAGFRFTVVSSDVEEWEDPAADPAELVAENARRKARAVAVTEPQAVVLGADTTVALDGRIFGKPRDEAEAAQFLALLSGRTHFVYTGVAVCVDGGLEQSVERTEVTFRELSAEAIADYIDAVHVLDKAGAYALQDGGERIVERVAGSRSNVIGLPLETVSALLSRWLTVTHGTRSVSG